MADFLTAPWQTPQVLSGNNGTSSEKHRPRQVRRGSSGSNSLFSTEGLRQADGRSRSSSVELDDDIFQLDSVPSVSSSQSVMSAIFQHLSLSHPAISDVAPNPGEREPLISTVSPSLGEIRSVISDVEINQTPTSIVSPDVELIQPTTFTVSPDVEINQPLGSSVSPDLGESESPTPIVLPDVEIIQPISDISTLDISSSPSPITLDITENQPSVSITSPGVDLGLAPSSVVSPEVDTKLLTLLPSSPEVGFAQTEDCATSPVEMLDESPDVLEDPGFAQATLDSIATARLTPLIKQELKCLIQIRRHFYGQDLTPDDTDRDNRIEEPYQPTKEDIRRRERRRDLNKLSARRCREKKNEEEASLEKELDELLQGNQALQEEIFKLRKEKNVLDNILNQRCSCKCDTPYPGRSQHKASVD